jgi:hypothetical protein
MEIPNRLYEFVDYDELMKTPMSEEDCAEAISSFRSLLDD